MRGWLREDEDLVGKNRQGLQFLYRSLPTCVTMLSEGWFTLYLLTLQLKYHASARIQHDCSCSFLRRSIIALETPWRSAIAPR
jgi:hypothetical protein